MSEDKSSAVSMIEAHEAFVQHIEEGSSKIRTLSVITVVVAALLLVSYVYQLLVPFITRETVVSVNLADPLLQVFELALVAITAVWLYVGVTDYIFTRRLAAAIREARALEKDIEARVVG